MGIKVSNNAYGVLAAGITATDTTISVGSGEGARFPSLGGSDYFYMTLIDTANNIEIVKVTARATDTMTVVRGQDGTTAKIYPINSRVELRPCAALFDSKADLAYVDAALATKMAYVAPGTAGNILKSNGIAWESGAAPAGGFSNIQVFTSSGTFTVPAGVTKVKVTVVGGGGGGGGQSTANYASQAGGGGGVSIKVISGLTPGGTVSVTVGNGGAGGSGNAQGSTGGTSSFGAYCSATGGEGGAQNLASAGWLKGNGGLGSSGDVNGKGSFGAWFNGGAGGGSPTLGGGATFLTANGNGNAGVANTGGGGGGCVSSTATATGGTGGSGVVIVEY